MEYYQSQIDYIARVRNYPIWDNEIAVRTAIVQAFIAKLRTFANLAQGHENIKNAVNASADKMQNDLDAAIAKHLTNE